MPKTLFTLLCFIVFLSKNFAQKSTSKTNSQKTVANTLQNNATTVADTLIWYNTITAAHEVSKKTNKPIFAFFTGSDWCGWCMRLQTKVLRKEAFKQWANKNVVLLELDFPRRKALPDTLMQHNKMLANLFKVNSYPTIIIFDINQKTVNSNKELVPYGSLGYPPNAEEGKELDAFLQTASSILQNRK